MSLLDTLMTKQFWLDTAELNDAWRVVPRAVLLGYGYECHRLINWFMTRQDLTNNQAMVVGGIVGLAVPLVGWYMQTGRKWQ